MTKQLSRHLSLFLMGLFFLVSRDVDADICGEVFTGPVASHQVGGKIDFAQSARLRGTNGSIDIGIGANNSNVSCDSFTCRSSGSIVNPFTPRNFINSTSSADRTAPSSGTLSINQGDYDQVTLQQNSTLHILNNGNKTAIRHLNIHTNSSLVIAGGQYWLQRLTMAANTNIAVNGNEKVTLFVESTSLAQNIRLNWNGDPNQLVIILYSNTAFPPNTFLRGFVHGTHDISLNRDSMYVGSVVAGNLILGQNSIVSYDAVALNSAPLEAVCDVSRILPEPTGYWAMDMCSVNTSNSDVSDQKANNNGRAHNSVGIDFNGKYCQSARFTGELDFIDIAHNNDYATAQGSLSFWINTDDIDFSNRSNVGEMTLLSKDDGIANHPDGLSIRLTGTGTIVVKHQTLSDNFYIYTQSYITENNWHHIAYSWGNQGMRLFINGIERGVNTAYSGSLVNNTYAITLGANATHYQSSLATSKEEQLTDFYRGSLDEFRFYNEQLNSTQIDKLFNLSAQACQTCTVNPQAVAHYTFDLCSVSGNTNEIVDQINGNNGQAFNGVSTSSDGKFCQSVIFSGKKQYVGIEHTQHSELVNGAFALWFNIDVLSQTNSSSRGANTLFSKDNEVDSPGHVGAWVLADGRIQILHQTSDGEQLLTTTGSVSEGQWHHLAYSFGSNGAEIFVDGQLVLTSPNMTQGISTNTAALIIGANAEDTKFNATQAERLSDFFNGRIDDVKIVDAQPTLADVNNWYNESPYACSQCLSAFAYYDFSDNIADNANSVNDQSGNNRDGSLLADSAIFLPENNKSCQAMQIAPSTSRSVSNALDTHIDVNDIGSKGGISFWYKANERWGNGRSRQLFDASKLGTSNSASGSSKYFFLAMLNNGRLRFGIETDDDLDLLVDTSNQSFRANEWVHIAVSWDLTNQQFQVYVNGVSAGTITENELVNDSLGELDTLYFGDNRSNYLVNQASANSANGAIDEVRIYKESLGFEQVQRDMASAQVCESLSHYLISHPEQALTCSASTITVKACANSSCSILHDRATQVILSPSSITDDNSINFTGSARVNLNHRSSGRVTLGLASTSSPAPVQCDPDCTIDYSDLGFEFFNVATSELSLENTHFVAETALVNVGIRAVNNTSGTCEALTEGGEQQVKLTYACRTKVEYPYTSSSCAVPFAGIPLSGGDSHSGILDLTFDANGEANLGGFKANDVGLLELNISAMVNSAKVQSAQSILKIVPAELLLNSTMPNPLTAGTAYSLKLSALGALGNNLPSYQASRLEAQVIRLLPDTTNAMDAQWYANSSTYVDSQLQSIADTASNTGFHSITAPTFLDGHYTSEQAYFEEVGTYKVSFRDSDYLGMSFKSNSEITSRVIPAYFDVSVPVNRRPEITPSCSSSFTYIGQSFSFNSIKQPTIDVIAYNAKGQVTNNYAGNLWRLNPSQQQMSSSISYIDKTHYAGNLNTINIGLGPAISDSHIYNGRAVFSIKDAELNYSKLAKPSSALGKGSPFDTKIDMSFSTSFFTDPDGICYQSSYPAGCENFVIADITGTELRYGRLSLTNAFGPDTHTLSVPMQTEFYVDGSWRLNVADSCTPINLKQSAADIVLTDLPESIIDLTSMINDVKSMGNIEKGQSGSANLLIGPVLNSQNEVQSGAFKISLNATKNTADWSEFLNIDWNNDGSIDGTDSPEAMVTFGIYRGNDRTIHWREVFN